LIIITFLKLQVIQSICWLNRRHFIVI
jgi:hypothetical protein